MPRRLSLDPAVSLPPEDHDAAAARPRPAWLDPRTTVGRARLYSPYAVDWRFLPEDVLFVKDFVRYHLVKVSNSAAQTRHLSSLWAETIGHNIGRAVSSAGILFVHIPKTGGTSISKVLYNRNLPHYTARFWSDVFGSRVSGLPSFAVIRHPVERMVSAYRMATSGGTDIVAYSRYWRARLKGLRSLDAFVDHVFENRTRLHALPEELRPQVDFVLSEDGRVMVDRLFSLDGRRGLSPELARWLGSPALPHLNATAPLAVEVSSAARWKIGKIYRRDFQLYHLVARQGGFAEMRNRVLDAD